MSPSRLLAFLNVMLRLSNQVVITAHEKEIIRAPYAPAYEFNSSTKKASTKKPDTPTAPNFIISVMTFLMF